MIGRVVVVMKTESAWDNMKGEIVRVPHPGWLTIRFAIGNSSICAEFTESELRYAHSS